MTTVKCSKCGNEISDNVKFCPHCGYNSFDGFARNKTTSTANSKVIVNEPENYEGEFADYRDKYNVYKKLPSILGLTFFFLISFAAVICAINTSNILFLLGLPIGAAVGGITYFITSLSIAPTVLRTDAVLDIKRKLEEKIQKEESDKK